MKLYIDIKPFAKQENVERIDENHFRVAVKAVPHDGKANLALLEILARYLKVPKSSLTIVSGHTSRHKILELKNR